MADGLDSDAVSLALGRAENSAIFVDLPVKGVFRFDQHEPRGMDIRGDLDLPPGGSGAKAGFECVFQKIRQHQTHIDLVHGKRLRQIQLGTEGDPLTLCKGTVIAYNTVRRPVFAKALRAD